jgi:hypothetical protein
MGGGNMNKILGDFVKLNYPDSKADLMACFMEAGLNMLKEKGFLGMINQHSWMFLSSYEKLREKLIENVFFDTNLHLGARTFPEIGGEVVQNTAFTFWNKVIESKGCYFRLVNYNSTEEKRIQTIEAIKNPDCVIFFKTNQLDFKKIPGSAIGYWLSDKWITLFDSATIQSITESEGQTKSGNNDKYLRLSWEININAFGKDRKWVKHPKGGSFRRWFGNLDTVIDWSENSRKHYRKDSVARILVEKLWWKKGISWTLITSGKQSFRDYDEESIFNLAAPTLFFKNENDRKYSLGLLNSHVTEKLLKVYNPTLNCNIGEVQAIPLLFKQNKEVLISLVENTIGLSKIEWNSRETSWDFQQNELIRIRSQDLEETYDLYKQYWKNKFFQLHKNEEELNLQFIAIYGLQDELIADVPLEDITILKEETHIENGQLVFNANEIFAQFVSYAVGCMLIFMPDQDNIIPILDDEWFEDDIVARLYAFLKASFGENQFQKNLAFVEDSLGKDIRKFFNKDFYPDHIKRYKKRPIYWMFSSPKGSFNVLIYLHRYTPDTLNKILNSYLREFIEKLTLQRKQYEHIENNGTPAEQNKATKEIDKIDIKLADCKQYEIEILYPLASERIALDLDDGVLVNYNKLGKAVAEVAGLNDKATKKKVKEFDWIDTNRII